MSEFYLNFLIYLKQKLGKPHAGTLTDNNLESGPMSTPWKMLAGSPVIPRC